MKSLATEAMAMIWRIAVGDQLVGLAVEDGDREVGAAAGGLVGGLLDACLQSAEPGSLGSASGGMGMP